MICTINGVETSLTDGITLSQLVEEKGLNVNAVVIELNREILKRESFTDTTLKDKDIVEVLSFVGGG